MYKGRLLRVSYGVGVDSTAMLVGFHRQGVRPDLILFADTGSELPETYAYLPVIARWLDSVGFPPVITVKNASPRAGHTSLWDECVRNGVLPSVSYRRNHSCALKWKVDPQEKFCNNHPPFVEACRRGERILTAIGYDAGPADGRRLCKAFSARERKPEGKRKRVKFDYWYPLIEWGWDRERCEAEIRAEGLPVPVKSSCFFCGARKKHEILELHQRHPDLFWDAVEVEDRARPRLTKIKGLGTYFSWGEFLAEDRERGERPR